MSKAIEDEIVQKAGSQSVNETVSRLCELIEARGMHVFTVIDHSGEAAARGLHLRETKVVIFGSPETGTAIMDAVPLLALDLPLKVLIWSDEGLTTVSYLAPPALASR